MASVRIGARFNGPPDSGNGGYSCGAFARTLGSDGVTVTLRRPPPLERDLEIVETEGRLAVMDREDLIAEVTRSEILLPAVPEALSLRAAAEASQHYVGLRTHAFPTCFVCGTARADGLSIFPGPIASGVAATWTPDHNVCADGVVLPEFVSAALDCPSGWAAMGQRGEPYVLGRMTAWTHAPVPMGEPLVVQGWPLQHDGRKIHAASAIFDADGRCVACADTVWIRMRA